MAVPQLEMAVKEALAPPTPPSDQMDIDPEPEPNMGTHEGPLQNGAPPAPEKTGSEQPEDAPSPPKVAVPVASSNNNTDTNAHGRPLPNGAPVAPETAGPEQSQDSSLSPPAATVESMVIDSQNPSRDHEMDTLPNGTALVPKTAALERLEASTSAEELDPAPTSPSLPPPSSAPIASSVVDRQESLNNQAEPTASAKVAREREDDEMDYGPATKRTKTDGDRSSSPAAAVPEFKVPDLPEINTNVTGGKTQTGEPKPVVQKIQPITKPQHKFILRVIQNIKRTNDAIPFNKPVDTVALSIPSYPTIVTKPMDLKTMEEKLKNNEYPSIFAFVADFNQIVENSIAFNGQEHLVTKNAQNIKASFDKQMLNLPATEVVDPPPADKRKKAPATTAPKATPSRRESRSSLPGSARSPTTAASPTFALGPQGVPLIRRDSTVGDGRPKREIHPPAPRDLPYANQKPKKKKYQWELKFCQHVINELTKPKYGQINFPFVLPVDPVALNIPHYHKLIKNPMDLGTVGSKLNHGQYENAKEFEADIRLIFQNCYKFNPSADPVHTMGKNLEAVFDEKWADKSRWIEANTPASGRPSPGTSPEPEEEEEEEEDEDEEEEQNQLSKLQQQIAAMSRQVELITQKKTKSPPVPAKKVKGGKATTNKKDGKKTASAAPIKGEKKAAKSTKKEKTPYVTYEQKQDISNRINSLSETRMATALKIIRDNMPSLKGVQEDEIELDIDELSDEVLHKLLVFVRKHAPRPEDSPPRKPAPASQTVAAPRKKNKPMSKTEQEARIQKVKGNLSAFQQNPGADEAHGSVNNLMQANDSSGDDDVSEESEEE